MCIFFIIKGNVFEMNISWLNPQVIISEYIIYQVLLECKTDTIRCINYCWN